MNTARSEAGPPQDAAPISLRDKTTRGLAWAASETLAAKALSIVSQIVLAWLLVPRDFGLIGLAFTVTAFTGLLTEPGLRVILIQRQKEFDRLAGPTFWMAMTTGVLGALVVVAAAPAAARFYHEPRLVPLLVLLAIAAPLSNASLVNSAKVNIDMRFRALALVGILTQVANVTLTIILAALGFGAYSLAIPVPIVAGLRSIIFWGLAPCRLSLKPQFAVVRSLLRDTATLFASNLILTVTWQGGYIVLGLFYNAAVVGIYYFAFNLSMQVMQLFQSNLSRVLFPALSSIQHDIVRQTRGFLRAVSMLALLAVPFAFLQAGLAEPLIHLVFQSKWWPAIPVLQILSVGMALRVVGSPGGSLMQAQGRYGTILIINTAYALAFLTFVTVASRLGEALAVALGAAAYFTLLGPIHLYIASRPGGATWKDIAQVIGPPVISAAISVGAGMLLATFLSGALPGLVHHAILREGLYASLVASLGVGGYWLLVRRWRPQPISEIAERVRSLVRSRRLRDSSP